MRELFQEIWSSISRNKLRTFLTGFSVAWGIFMLIILLGSGNGLQNGIMSNLGTFALNSINIYSGRTSMPYKGFQQGRQIRLKMSDVDLLKKEFPEQIDKISATLYVRAYPLTYGELSNEVYVRGTLPGAEIMDGMILVKGRLINEIDNAESRKVMVINESTDNAMFKGKDPIGETVMLGSIAYTVVGVYKTSENYVTSNIYLPLATASKLYNGGRDNVDNIFFTMNGLTDPDELLDFENNIRKTLGAEHTFSPDDRNAVWINNNQRQFNQMNTVFAGIAMFIWVIGIGTLMAGIVGVSNIMLVSVRERTAEFGIRKALGAKPSSLVQMVLIEAVMITAFFGYVGMIAGIGVMEIVNLMLERNAASAADQPVLTTFLNPTLNLSVTLSATIVLIIAGMIAGYIPARRAAKLKTIDAMRHNK